MEIVLNNMSYLKNKMNYKYCLKNISIQFNSSYIYGIVNYDIKLLYRLLVCEERVTSGTISIGDSIITKSNDIDTKVKEKICYVGDYYREFKEATVKDFFLGDDLYLAHNKIENERIKKVLMMVLLDEGFLVRNPNTLSMGEKKKIILAKSILDNPEVFIIDNFSLGFNYKEQEYFQKLLLKFKTKYGKSFIVSDSLEFLFNIVDNIVVINNGKIELCGNKELFYEDKLYEFVDVPRIVDFTKYVLSMDVKINNYTDLKELIKEIYRNLRYH